MSLFFFFFFFSSRRRHTRYWRDWSSDVCSSDLVELDAGVLGRTGRLLVGREQGVLERGDEHAGRDSLLLLERPHGFDDLAAHEWTSGSSGTRLERWTCERGISNESPESSTRTASSPASAIVPMKFRRPSIALLVRTLTR